MKYTIGQVLERIQKGDKMNEIVSEFGLLKKHFQEQLKELGYRGDRAGRYHWDHNEPEPLDFDLLAKYIKRVLKFKEEASEAFSEPLEEVTENKDKKADNEDKIKKFHDEVKKNAMEKEDEHPASNSISIARPLIQFVEEKKEEPKKVFKGFYLNPELAAIFDKIQNKSEVANTAIEKFFKEQGLL